MLAENPDERNKELAKGFWFKTLNYDFHPIQMEADDSLLKLDLLIILPDGNTRIYGPKEES